MNFTFEDIWKIYNRLEDEISREIYMARMSYSATHNEEYVINMLSKYKNIDADTRMLTEQIFNNKYKIVICGAGVHGRTIASSFRRIEIFAFIDNYREEKIDIQTNLPIYSFEDYMEIFGIGNTNFLISVLDKESILQIEQQLLNIGVSKQNIIKMNRDWRNNTSQYFDVFTPKENEVFVDCGCFDGSSAFGFAAWCRDLSYNKIVCFEPDPQLYKKCNKAIKKLSDCYLYPYGVSNQSGTVSFLANGREDAHIVTSNLSSDVEIINTVDLNTFLADERITFIKMDIEGAEYDALIGASDIIKNQKPRLAISIYHNLEHIVTIPKLLLSLRDDYKFKLRHYSMLPNETILYAE